MYLIDHLNINVKCKCVNVAGLLCPIKHVCCSCITVSSFNNQQDASCKGCNCSCWHHRDRAWGHYTLSSLMDTAVTSPCPVPGPPPPVMAAPLSLLLILLRAGQKIFILRSCPAFQYCNLQIMIGWVSSLLTLFFFYTVKFSSISTHHFTNLPTNLIFCFSHNRRRHWVLLLSWVRGVLLRQWGGCWLQRRGGLWLWGPCWDGGWGLHRPPRPAAAVCHQPRADLRGPGGQCEHVLQCRQVGGVSSV